MLKIGHVSLSLSGRAPKNASTSNQTLLLYLLLGAVTIQANEKKCQQNTNFSKLPPSARVHAPAAELLAFIKDAGHSGKIDAFIKRTATRNRRWYKEMLSEFCNYFTFTAANNHIAAFVSLYRITEYYAYAVPMLIACVGRDLYGTYDQLRSYFVGGDQQKGELGLFKKFLEKSPVFKEILDYEYDVFITSNLAMRQSHYRLAIRLCPNPISADETLHSFKVRFQDVLSFLIRARNRYMHFAIGQRSDNVHTDEILAPNEFFGCLNPIFVSFLAYILLETIGIDGQ
ncbi:hypothetical protein [Cupriavidus taiwanensis]|uniref:Uncharacterized protein n=1 Tax=Cupriavidus taiwanensis TaxID=164546 RepID=A0A375ITK7_9BURK|nr:hypothetical protein [Cupriavidus taiwanensis]SPR95925.1 conserved hypothetical protein [Cupriavidus taiwanensis]